MLKQWKVLLACGLPIWLAGACSDGSSEDEAEMHEMSLENNTTLMLPQAWATLAGDEVTLSTMSMAGGQHREASPAFEILQAGFGYRAWARVGATYQDLGAFTPGTDLHATAADATTALITIESTASTPAAPSAQGVITGPVGVGLTFGTLTPASFGDAGATASVGEKEVGLSYHDLPALPSGYHYELWMVGMTEDGEHSGTNMPLGTLDHPEHGEMPHRKDMEMPHAFNLQITIEADSGHADMSPLACMTLEHDGSMSPSHGDH